MVSANLVSDHLGPTQKWKCNLNTSQPTWSQIIWVQLNTSHTTWSHLKACSTHYVFFCFEGMFLNIFCGCATECLSQQLLSVFLISFEGMIESWSQQCLGSWVLGHPYNLGLSRGWAPDCRQFAVVTHIIL